MALKNQLLHRALLYGSSRSTSVDHSCFIHGAWAKTVSLGDTPLPIVLLPHLRYRVLGDWTESDALKHDHELGAFAKFMSGMPGLG